LLVHQVKERLHLITSFYLAYNEPEDEQTETFLRGFLGRMLFSGEEVKKKASVLSGILLSIQRTFSPPESTLAFFLTSSPLNNIRPKKPRKNVSVCSSCVNMNLVDWLRQYAPEDEQTETFLRGFLGRMLFSTT
jgi:ATPase subunit of ABC transporter with duplicated ATPase domains